MLRFTDGICVPKPAAATKAVRSRANFFHIGKHVDQTVKKSNEINQINGIALKMSELIYNIVDNVR